MTDADPTPGLPPHAFDVAPFAVAATRGADHRLTYANARHRGVFGHARIGEPFHTACPDLAGSEVLERMNTVLRSGEPQVLSTLPVAVHTAGEPRGERLFTVSMSVTVAEDGQRGVLVMAVDMTGQIEDHRHSLHRSQRLLDANVQKTWVADPYGRLIECSGWEQVTGLPWSRLEGHGWLDTAHPEDREGLAQEWLRATQELPEVFEHTYRLRYRDGSYRHCRLRAVPLREQGEVLEWVAGCADVEEQWREERRATLVARATAAVAESQGLEEAFAELSHVIVPALVDHCGMFLLADTPRSAAGLRDTDLTVQRVASTARAGMPPGLPPHGEVRIPTESGFASAVRERRPIQAAFPPGQIPPGLAPPGLEVWLTQAGAHSGALVPVLVDGVVAAVVSCFTCSPRDPIGREHTALIQNVLEEAHDALRNALELQRTQQVAHALQHSLLTEPPHVPGLQIAARYVASAASAEVGGDWYDCFVLPDGVTSLVIGDVAGHDLSAAVTMSKLRNMLRGLAVDRQEPPGDIVRRLDLAAQVLGPSEATSTCVFCRAEPAGDSTWCLNYAAAGHPPPLLISRDGSVRLLEDGRGPLLGGVAPDVARENANVAMEPHSTLLLYTDGLIERPGEDIDISIQRLCQHAGSLAASPLHDMCDELTTTHNPATHDDIALIALRAAPEPGAGGG